MADLTTDEIEQGACTKAKNPEIFFPQVEAGWIDRTAEAKSYCGICPVAVNCLLSAMAEGYDGVWGGTTAAERTQLRKNKQALEEQIKYLSI